MPYSSMLAMRLRQRVVGIEGVIKLRIDMMRLKGNEGLKCVLMGGKAAIRSEDVFAESDDRLDRLLIVRRDWPLGRTNPWSGRAAS